MIWFLENAKIDIHLFREKLCLELKWLLILNNQFSTLLSINFKRCCEKSFNLAPRISFILLPHSKGLITYSPLSLPNLHDLVTIN
ncbi:hypothetical protein BpHYR1_027614 [Brachionus plicatilis]|uniref:Uncharacterized protein n=1 Tax=Brachionus plicatilis TaxID=10195 RepID=A0A3M7S4A4_BRAPC|nr:hypothetical protein BpHYR1_027614 [Brachionus plicatilis]